MSNLRDQMEVLAQGIATSERERRMSVGACKAQTARTLQTFARERAAMAAALKSGLAADRVSRSANVGTMCDEFGRERDRMGRDLRQKLVRSSDGTVTFVASLCADFAKAHHRMTKAQRAELAKGRRDRSREVAELLNDFHAWRGRMARELAESLAKSTQEIKSQVAGLHTFRASLDTFRVSPHEIPDDALAPAADSEQPAGGTSADSGPSREPGKRQKKRSQKQTGRAFNGKPGETEETNGKPGETEETIKES